MIPLSILTGIAAVACIGAARITQAQTFGPTGEGASTGFPGPLGYAGPTGQNLGPTGPTGEPGPRGETGLNSLGPVGDTGHSGSQGSAAVMGPTGIVGRGFSDVRTAPFDTIRILAGNTPLSFTQRLIVGRGPTGPGYNFAPAYLFIRNTNLSTRTGITIIPSDVLTLALSFSSSMPIPLPLQIITDWTPNPSSRGKQLLGVILPGNSFISLFLAQPNGSTAPLTAGDLFVGTTTVTVGFYINGVLPALSQ